MNLWDTIINIWHPQAGGDSKPVHLTQILKHQGTIGDIDYVLPNAYIFEENETAIKQMKKRQKSFNASCITHSSG